MRQLIPCAFWCGLVCAGMLRAAPDKGTILDNYGRLPLFFEPNVGQAAPQTRYVARGSGYTLLLTDRDAILQLKGAKGSVPHAARMKLAGSRAPHSIEASELQTGRSNYFLGNDPAQWRQGVAHYSRVRWREAYPGIDTIFYGNQSKLEFDFVVAPGADPSRIQLEWEGVDTMRLDSDGNLVLQITANEMQLHRPLVYQEIDGRRVEVSANYRLKRGGRVGLTLARYDRSRPLVIDPVLTYASYLGGSQNDHGNSVAVDSAGNAYICGDTSSANFPTSNGLPVSLQGTDAFVLKLNPAGSTLLYSTYLGGSGTEIAYGVAVDADGAAYAAGSTNSTNLPVVNPITAMDKFQGGPLDAFVAKLSPGGNSLIYSTYLGGEDQEEAYGIAVDSDKFAYVTGYTLSGGFPTTAGSLGLTRNGSSDAFISKISQAGSALVYSAMFGGNDGDGGQSIALDGANNAYISGFTVGLGFPTTASAFQKVAAGGSEDAFVVKVNPSGSAFAYATYVGGDGDDNATGIAVDDAGRVYITGYTNSSNLPTTTGALRTTNNGFADSFVAKLNSSGSALIYASYLGGGGFDFGRTIKVNAAGNAFVAGTTQSTNFPTAGTPLKSVRGGTSDGFLSVMNPLGTALAYSTYIGGAGTEDILGLDLDSTGNAYLTGFTTSSDFPATQGSVDTTANGGDDAFAAKFQDFNLTSCLSPLGAGSTTVSAAQTPGTIPVLSVNGCNWNGISSMGFVSITSGSSGTGTGSIGYLVAANNGNSPRAASVSAAGNIVQIMQAPAVPSSPFTDVPVNDPFVNHLALMKANAITSGCTTTTYCPNDTTTRGQMAVFIIRAMLGGDNFPFSATPYFTDVPANSQFFKWIQKMKELGITSGCTTTTYCPNDPVTRGQMAVFIVRGLTGNKFTSSNVPYFNDVPSTNAFFSYIQKMKEWGITSGCSSSAYCINDNTVRSQMGVFIIRAFFSPR